MDKYLIKRPRSPTEESSKKPASKRLRQATIESLKGVVVVEDILRYKSLLKIPDQKSDVILDTLHKLGAKIPSRDVLQSTKIGHTVNRLTTHSDSTIVQKAQELVDRWRAHYVAKQDRPQIEVKCDKKTEDLRQRGRNMLSDAMQQAEGSHRLAEAIERETYVTHKRLVGQSYRRNLRHLIFALKNHESVRTDVLSGDFSISDFVKTHNKQVAKS